MATEILRPNATGDEESISHWKLDTEAGHNHWEAVDEASADDMATYVRNYENEVYERDLYNIPDSGVGAGTINHITIYFRCRSSGTGYAKPSLKSDSTVTDGTEVNPIDSWTNFSQQWTTNPADAGAWEWADINALQIGVSLKHGGRGNDSICTQVYVVVDYTVVGQTISSAGAIASLEAFGSHQLNMAMSAAGAIASLEAFGTPITAGPITCTGIASLEAFGTPIVAGPITCTGIASLEAFGTSQLNLKLEPSAIASLEAFGTPTLILYLLPSSISSLEAFGTHQLNLELAPTAIASLEAFGTPLLILYLLPSSIASLEAFGTPIVAGPITCTGIASLEAFGTPQLNLTIFPSAIASAEAFGFIDVIINVYPAGALGYVIEVRDSSGNLLAFLENATGINLVEQLNRPPMLDFRLPADDSKISHIDPDNEYWLRNYETGVLVKKFLISRRRDTRR